MLAKATVSPGVLRGGQLISKYMHRLKGMLGFQPFPGTMNLKIDRKLDFRVYATKPLEHILLDGTRHIEAYLAPARLHIGREVHDCWAFWPFVQDKTTRRNEVEIIAKENIHKKFGLKDGDEVGLELIEHHIKPKKNGGILKRLFKGESRLSR